MIKIICSLCKEELTAPGGLLFSPPRASSLSVAETPRGGKGDVVIKYHICTSCYKGLLGRLELAEARK